MADLFQNSEKLMRSVKTPLADQLRPKSLDQIVGQRHIFNENRVFLNTVRNKKCGSFILCGPPGVGKTTISRVLAEEAGGHFVELKAFGASISELRSEFDAAKVRFGSGRSTILFIDEIHRFNKAQQDTFLPHMENGTINLIGATTENPNFVLNPALISRALILELFPLTIEDLEEILVKAEKLLKRTLPTSKGGRNLILRRANGDARILINMAERIFESSTELSVDEILNLFAFKTQNYSKSGDEHFNFISALQKSIRGSDVDAALYWLARILSAGEDARYVLRRVLRTSYEDIGLADLTAQEVCLNALRTFEKLGSPEGDIALAQAVIYISLAPKSNSVYSAFERAKKMASKTSSMAVPNHLVTLKPVIGPKKGTNYINDHDTQRGFSGQKYFPDSLTAKDFYRPINRGQERELVKRLDYFNKLRNSDRDKKE